MTLEEIYECSYEQLLAMSDAELTKHFEPFLHVTRPELAAKKSIAPAIDPKMAFKLQQLKALGIDVDLTRRKKK